MELLFATPELQAIASSERGLQKIFGAHARRAAQRLNELAASENLGIAATLPTLEMIRHDGDIRYSVCVSQVHRIFFEIANLKPTSRIKPIDIAATSIIRIVSLGEIQ